MSFHQFMQARQRFQFQAVGEFLYIEASPGVVSISTQRGSYQLEKGAQVIDPKLSGLVTVENMGEAGTVTIICGYGRYIPPTDGQKVQVTQLPEVVLSSGQQVNIGTMPQVALVEGQAVTVEQLPKVQLADEQSLIVSQLPKMQLEAGQAVRVYATTALLTKPVGGSKALPTVLTLSDGAGELAENTGRCHVLLKAPGANTAAVSLGGYELEPGERLKLETTGPLSFTGSDGDKIQVIEVMK